MLTREPINKGELQRHKRELDLYVGMLPSIDMKRRQLVQELGAEARKHATIQQQYEAIELDVREKLPMLAGDVVNAASLLKVGQVDLAESSVQGIRLPTVRNIDFVVLEYSMLGYPHWIDATMACLRESMRLQIEMQVSQRRIQLLQKAIKKALQRQNMLENVLIPEHKAAIHRLRLGLSEAEVAAVIRAKIAKSMQQNATI